MFSLVLWLFSFTKPLTTNNYRQLSKVFQVCDAGKTFARKLLLQNVQRRTTKLILNYPKDMSYKNRYLGLSYCHWSIEGIWKT